MAKKIRPFEDRVATFKRAFLQSLYKIADENRLNVKKFDDTGIKTETKTIGKIKVDIHELTLIITINQKGEDTRQDIEDGFTSDGDAVE